MKQANKPPNYTSGVACSQYTVQITTRGATPDNLRAFSDCQYGDTVQLNRVDATTSFSVWEIAVVGKPGQQSYN